MKQVKYFIMLFTFFAMFPFAVSAEEVNNETFSDCIASDSNTCVLTEDVVSPLIDITGNIVLDLNGYSITPTSGLTYGGGLITIHNGAKLTINDSVGTGKITTGDNVVLTAIAMTKNGDDATNEAILVVNGGSLSGYFYGIAGNGNRHNTNITINGGKIYGLDSDGNTGIYHPQVGKLVINGGTITGDTGIEMRSGSLTVNGGNIIGTYIPIDVTSNGNGPTSLGAGIAIAQHSTLNAIELVINGGTIEGYSAVYESNPEGNAASDIEKVSLSITGGTLNAINGGTVVVYSEDFEEFVTGGTFNEKVTSSYVKTGYEIISGTNNYTVEKIVPKTDVTELNSEEEVEEVVVGVENAEETEEVLMNSLESLLTTDENLSTIVETESVTISIEMTNIDETDLADEIVSDIKEKAGNSTIATYLDISVAVRKTDSGELLTTISELTEEVTLMVLLPEELKNTNENMVRTYYVIRRHIAEDGTIIVEKLPTTLSSDGNSLTFETAEFSTYALAYSDSTIETTANPQTFDGIGTSCIIGLLSLIGLVGTTIYFKKRNKVRA